MVHLHKALKHLSVVKKVAIVGVGPRGLSALENLYHELSTCKSTTKVHTTLFDVTEYPGAGPVWNPDQPDTNWMNISERALQELKERQQISYQNIEIPMFPSYRDWDQKTGKQKASEQLDSFPPRSKMGVYLHERFMSIFTVLSKQNLAHLVKDIVHQIQFTSNHYIVHTAKESIYKVDEVLLAIGHQETEISEQIKSWSEHVNSKKGAILFEDPYPVTSFTRHKALPPNGTVGVRGFGLAMIDVCRALTVGYGGMFEITNKKTQACIYRASLQSNLTIVPFSLDGLPPVPKPIGPAIDRLFKPSKKVFATFRATLRLHAQGKQETTSHDFFIQAMTNVIVAVYIDLGSKTYRHKETRENLSLHVKKWILDQNHRHPLFTDNTKGCIELMKAYLNMAIGNEKISLDYCAGQVWRYCQPAIYKELSHAQLSDEIIAAIVELDEKSKRYSYGPPVASIQQLLALADQGILTLAYVGDPTIKTQKTGWKFSVENKNVDVDVIINSVLDSPQILKVTSPLVKNLLGHEVFEPVHSELGVDTNKDGTFLYRHKYDGTKALAMVGRLCKGSVIGVDAILECFGPRINDWAKGAVARLLNTP